jgi:hypothetical protein
LVVVVAGQDLLVQDNDEHQDDDELQPVLVKEDKQHDLGNKHLPRYILEC